MTVVARRLNAIPKRSAIDVWNLIVSLTAPTDSVAFRELKSIEGIAASIITDEAPKDTPIVFYGSGPRVRFFCLYNEESIAGDQASEGKLSHCPTENDWRVSLPCLKQDMDWVNKALANKSQRVTARQVGTEVVDSPQVNDRAGQSVTIDLEAFYRP